MFESIRFYTKAAAQEALVALPYQHILVLLSDFCAQSWGLEDSLLEKEKDGWLWVKRVDPNPTEESVFDVLRQLEGRGLDAIVAVGGGSAIDLGKAVGALWKLGGLESAAAVFKAVCEKRYLQNGENMPPLVAIPTTAGTGSEVTRWASLWRADGSGKYSVDAPWLAPSEVWMVPEYTLSMPKRLTLSTGLDAACHAAEAFWAKPTNPLVKALSLKALAMLAEWLPQVLAEPASLQAREAVATAALLAGMAFSRTRTTACHSISYPLTALFGVEHGFAAALTVAEVAKLNSSAVDCGTLFAVFAPYGGLQTWLDSVSREVQVLRLSAFGIGEKDIPAIVSGAFTAGRMDNNPVDLSEEQVAGILRRVL